jgi:hypothetical protein
MRKMLPFELLGPGKLAPSLFGPVEKHPTQHQTIIKPNVTSCSSELFKEELYF